MVAIRVLALDISLRSTGWAVGSPGEAPRWGTFKTTKASWEDREHIELHRFRLDVLAHHHGGNTPLSHIFFENIFVNTNPKAFQFAGTDGQLMFKGVVLDFCATHNITPSEPSVSQWRARFLGKDESKEIREATEARTDARRNEWKRRVMAECGRRGWMVNSDDEADALGILDYALCVLDRQHAGRTDPIFRRNQLRNERERYFGS